jgi:hypothetical protein
MTKISKRINDSVTRNVSSKTQRSAFKVSIANLFGSLLLQGVDPRCWACLKEHLSRQLVWKFQKEMSNNKRVIWKYILTFSFARSQIVGTNPSSSQLFQGVSLRYWTYLEDHLTLHVTGKFQVVTTRESSGNISWKIQSPVFQALVWKPVWILAFPRSSTNILILF